MSRQSRQGLAVRSSAAEFLIFTWQAGEDGIEVRYQDETIWMTQKMIAELFDTTKQNIAKHLNNIYAENELQERATINNYLTVQDEGSRKVQRKLKFYNLDAIISVGYRVNSKRATRFRQWATQVLSAFAVRGYVLDRKRMENGVFFSEDYFERLLEEIREIRLSERRFYQKITDIYATSSDYDKDAPQTREFFAKAQNKLHYAIHGNTASELMKTRADSTKANMGLTSWENAPKGKIVKSDVVTAKNYLSQEELDALGRIVNAYLELAESQAQRRIPMTMEDWVARLDKFLELFDYGVLKDAGSISAEIGKDHAKSEYEKYRIVQDRLFESDFDKQVKAIKKQIDQQTGEGKQ